MSSSAVTSVAARPPEQVSWFGHPPGLTILFLTEMWEQFSYYGMRVLLIFYMTKGFLGYGDKDAYAVYGAYTSLVYMTPFIGGICNCDRADCGAMQATVVHDMKVMFRAEYVAASNPELCTGCLACVRECPADAIHGEDEAPGRPFAQVGQHGDAAGWAHNEREDND